MLGAELAVIELTLGQMAVAIPELPDDRLDWLIETTDNAAVANRLARIERGRRTEKKQGSSSVLPGSTQSQTERNRRSEEMIVAEYDPTPEEVGTLGWKKIVNKARAHRRETTIAAPEVVVPTGGADWTQGDITLLHGDFRERLGALPDGSVDLIITDPPYPKDDLHLWGDLSEVAARILGPRGILFAMAGTMFLPEVVDHLASHLNYGWVFHYGMHEGSQSRIMGRHLIQTWKPILAYTTGKWPSGEWGKDEAHSAARSKDLYEWQQSEGDLVGLIERYSPPGGLIVDPFLGVGTYALDARATGRRFVGVELDAGRFGQSVRRLS